ncbi:MAG: ABC transporter ATP-binding protein [Patescibacteria group bacterium]|nr:ABC transporter ATP-binding protein [Patescibacteria group bacterium]
MIRFTDVCRSYDGKVAVDDLTLAIPSGELFGLLGPNGAGKTTTLKMLVGLLRPDRGSLQVCGHDVANEPRQAARFIGYVPDQPYLYDKLTGREFLEFSAEMRGLDRATTGHRIERESERFRLASFLDDLGETYSHGMKQRVVFASALLHDPPVLVIDEPMIGLDPRSVRLVKDHLRELAASGRTVLMSTHTLDVAEEIANRIGIIHRGRLHFLGTVSELRSVRRSHHASLEALFLALTEEDEQGPDGIPDAAAASQFNLPSDDASGEADSP